MNLNFFYHGEIDQPPNERRPVTKNNEFIHEVLMKQGYSQVKYKFTKQFTC
jgi:hypothetical protein